MRRLVFLCIGVLELVFTFVLINLGRSLPTPAEVDQGFARAERVTERAGMQVRLLRDQVQTIQRMELHQLSARLQKQTEAITNALRTQTVDFDNVSAMRDAIGELAKGLSELTDTVDPSNIEKFSNGLGATANFLEAKVVPAARGNELATATAPTPANESKNTASAEPALANSPMKRISFAGDQSTSPPNLTHVLPDAARVQELIDALRKGQTALETTQARWPQLRSTLKRLTVVLRTTGAQLDQAVDHRQDYESALEQTVQLADTFNIMLPLVTDQLDGRLDEEEQTLNDLGRNLDDVGQALPGYAQTTGRLFAAGRLLAWLLAGIVGLHGCYVALNAIARLGFSFMIPSCKPIGTAGKSACALDENLLR
jgi:TolA-binding protein